MIDVLRGYHETIDCLGALNGIRNERFRLRIRIQLSSEFNTCFPGNLKMKFWIKVPAPIL
jgi:hypothetical protein